MDRAGGASLLKPFESGRRVLVLWISKSADRPVADELNHRLAVLSEHAPHNAEEPETALIQASLSLMTCNLEQPKQTGLPAKLRSAGLDR